MKYCASLVIIFLLLIPTQVFAQENWLINNFASDIHIQEDGWVSVVEKIDVDFGSEQKHGIFRDIPYVYTYQNGAKLYTEIKVLSVRDSTNSSSIPYETFTSGDYTRIKIGDPGNLGTIFRSALAFDFKNIILDGTCADPYNFKVINNS